MPPPRNRRRNKSAADQHHKKVVHIEADDGWTHVARSANKTVTALPPEFRDANDNIAAQAAATAAGRKPRIEVHYSLDELKRHYQRLRLAWLACPEREALCHDLKQHASVAGSITKSVCLGLGSPSRMFMTMGSLKQMAIWLDILDTVSTLSGKPVQAFVQDPVFNSVDRNFFPAYDVKVLDHPAASEHMDEHCFVYGPHFSMVYAPREMRTASCPLTICNNVVPFIEGSPWMTDTLPDHADPESEQTRKEWRAFLSQRDSSPFLGNGKQAFDMQVNDMIVYWRRPS